MDGRRKRGMATLVLVVLGFPLLVVCSLSFSGPERLKPDAGGQPSRAADLTALGGSGDAGATAGPTHGFDTGPVGRRGAHEDDDPPDPGVTVPKREFRTIRLAA